jgi:hypothetical protein
MMDGTDVAMIFATMPGKPITGRYYSTDRTLPKHLRRTRRDGNEGARKGTGSTNRSTWLGGFSHGYSRSGNCGPDVSPTAFRVARQAPLFPFHEDGNERVAVACDVWEFRRFFDKRDGSLDEAREWMAGTFDASEYEEDRYWQEWDEAHPTSAMWLDFDFAPDCAPMVGI